jgi:hypothetical protein
MKTSPAKPGSTDRTSNFGIGSTFLEKSNEKLRRGISDMETSFVDYRRFLATESRALLSRLSQVKSFGLTMPMVPAASISTKAQKAIHQILGTGVTEMEQEIIAFIKMLLQAPDLNAAKTQKTFALLKLRFNWLLDSLDIFADVLGMRSEHDTGIWLAGMDALAEDSLRLNADLYQAPPLITYLDRGHGAAIRKARTRLPGGKSNPVAVIRVPRERMISTGIASSLVHEVGHQGADLLNLLSSLRQTLQARAQKDLTNQDLWSWYERWIGEIVSDFWGVAMVGIGATTGLINVVSVPSYFVFRLNTDDPHPPPWIRVRLSIAIGAVLYPDEQWIRLKKLWDNLYPIQLAGNQEKIRAFQRLEALIPAFVELLAQHQNETLKGKKLKAVFPLNDRQPNQLRKLYQQWRSQIARMKSSRPSLVFAVIGQARADQLMSPQEENHLLGQMLRYWALKRNIAST